MDPFRLRPQMRNCMSVGNAVGGVIAYEKQISISGVGFGIGCGNMAVRLDTPFSQIEGKVGTRWSTRCVRSQSPWPGESEFDPFKD